MKLFDVYSLYNIEPVRGNGCYVYDKNNDEYLDLYGGHAVISIGHTHPHYVKNVSEQLSKIGFYSNSVQNSLQNELAEKLGAMSNYNDYSLFLCNSGAEANENAIKVASFHNGKRKVLAFGKAFHGRTSGAVAATDNEKIISPFNKTNNVTFVALNNIDAVERELRTNEYCAVIIEGIQGVAGIHCATNDFFKQLRDLCTKYNVALIIDEIQSGYGRTGCFFAHQHADIRADIVTIAKGMGNGFPVAGVIIAPNFEAWSGMLGTTFGGNHLACAAAISVLDVMKNENLIENANVVGSYLIDELKKIDTIKEVRGKGLMIGIEMNDAVGDLRKQLLFDKKIFTGGAGTNIIRLLSPLSLSKTQADVFLKSLKELIEK